MRPPPPNVTVEEALSLAVNARRDLARVGIGISLSQLVFNKMPRHLQGDDLNEDAEIRIQSNQVLAEARSKRMLAEKSGVHARTWLQMSRMPRRTPCQFGHLIHVSYKEGFGDVQQSNCNPCIRALKQHENCLSVKKQ